MSKWYWRDGTLAVDFDWDSKKWLPAMKALDKKLGDFDYKVVKQTQCKNGYWISTVWLGLDHNLVLNEFIEPVIFETMVFGKEREEEFLGRKKMIRPSHYMERYPTEEEAFAGHKRAVNSWKNKKYIER